MQNYDIQSMMDVKEREKQDITGGLSEKNNTFNSERYNDFGIGRYRFDLFLC